MSTNTARRESITCPNGRVVTLDCGATDRIDDLFSLVQSVPIQAESDAGDPCDGYDRFGRVQEMRWKMTSGSSIIDGWQWGYNCPSASCNDLEIRFASLERAARISSG
ncbi:MAG: hypothetical protein JNK37_12550 [Verrucomicrobiales bacterium]|nr:hypothetical protein [Verrucomicrobiales bacterium]